MRTPRMDLETLLERCKRLEGRAAALYRSYAAASRAEPTLCALWTALAREEDEHAHSIVLAGATLEPTAGWRTSLEGWGEVLAEVEDRLAAAEQLGAEAPMERKLSAALEIEMTELETLRQVVLAACQNPHLDKADDHCVRLAEAAEQLSNDPQVRLRAALLKARARLKKNA